MHELNHDEKSGLCSTLPTLDNDMEARYDWLDSNIRNAKVATLTMERWKVLKAARDHRRFPDHDLWWCFFLSGLDFIMPYDAGAEAKESSSDDLMCKGPLPLLFDSMSVEAVVAMMKEVMLYEINIGDSAVIKAALDTATATNVQPKRKKAKVQNQTDVPVDVDQPGDHGIGEQPKVRGSRKAPQKRVAADLVVSNAEFSRLANVEEIRYWVHGVAWHMWAPILYLKRHNIPVSKPNDTAMFNLVRGVLKWAFLKTCVVNVTHATKTSTVLHALKKAILASNPSIFTDDVARGLAEGPPAASQRRRDQWSGASRFVELRGCLSVSRHT